MFSVNWVQHPVGHGGFHTGDVRDDTQLVFRWIFDCGSRRTGKFDIYLKSWLASHPDAVDWLFVSHFDTDHVSGLDTLMSRTVVRDVMVPYIDEHELAYLLLHEIDRGSLSRPLVELIADPTKYFFDRGASGVTFLGGPGGEEPPPETPADPSFLEGRKDWKTSIRPQPRRLQHDLATPEAVKTTRKLQIIENRGCHIEVSEGRFGLRLRPYRAPIASAAHAGLIAAVQSVVGPIPWISGRPGLGDLAFAIALHARTGAGRASLRTAFKKFVGSSNRSSLSLLTVPFAPSDAHCHSWIRYPFARGYGMTPCAWLNTGDAELLDPIDLADWRRFYGHDLGAVSVLALPHHGSDKNSDTNLQGLCPNAVLAAHVKSTAKKHPGPVVAAAAGSRLARVTEAADTEVVLRFESFVI